MLKVCTKCKVEKPLDAFHKNKSAKDGLTFNCKECARKKARLHYAKRNPQERLEIKRAWQETNREHVNSYNASWRKRNPEGHAAQQAERRARKNQATPPWLTKEQRQACVEMYRLAKKFKSAFGKTYHVDHIVPLKGENVCGLHVPWNLQLLESSLNLGKSNNLKETNLVLVLLRK